MNIVTVIPISRGIGKEMLSYFSLQPIAIGSIVSVPLRSKMIPALVTSFEPAEMQKSLLKNADFALKKISAKKSQVLFSPEFISAVHSASDYYACTPGAILSQMTSKNIIENAWKSNPSIENILDTEKTKATSRSSFPTSQPEPFAIQTNDDERLAYYKSLIREQFAKKQSVFFCVPSIQDSRHIFETLPKGIEQYAYLLHSGISKKKIGETWQKILLSDHPVLIIATGSFMGIPRDDIGTIVVERESATGYKFQSRPYLDIRTFAEMYAKNIQAQLIFSDTLLRVETLSKVKSGEYSERIPLKFRSLATAEVTIVDMRKYKTLDTPEFRIISNEIETLVKNVKTHNAHGFIYASRRGLAPTTVCGDCGTTVLCNRCSAPVVLHTSSQDNYFQCHRCGERRSAAERCRVCTSWKLTTLGIGIELVHRALQEIFPDMTLFRFDKDTVTTHIQARKRIEEFYSQPGSIVVGTEMTLPYLTKLVEYSAIASIDSLFSIPDFRIGEKIMSILLKIKSITQEMVVIQTRSKDQDVFRYIDQGNTMEFYRSEIEERKQLSYPPFSTLIKLTIQGKQEHVVEQTETILEDLKEYSPLAFPAFIETVRNKRIIHILIRLKPHQWVDQELLKKLKNLPPHVAINIDPETLL